jgi:hypothetical protein
LRCRGPDGQSRPLAITVTATSSPQALYALHAVLQNNVTGALNGFVPFPGTSWDIFFKTLQLFGVRYYIVDRGGAIIADQAGYPAITLPRRPLFGEPGLWRIYELPRPNVGNYSPTAVVTAASAPEIVAAMRAANFDFTRQVVLSVTPREPVVPAQDVQLSPIPGGLSPVGAQQGYIAPRLAAAIFELFARARSV